MWNAYHSYIITYTPTASNRTIPHTHIHQRNHIVKTHQTINWYHIAKRYINRVLWVRFNSIEERKTYIAKGTGSAGTLFMITLEPLGILNSSSLYSNNSKIKHGIKNKKTKPINDTWKHTILLHLYTNTIYRRGLVAQEYEN